MEYEIKTTKDLIIQAAEQYKYGSIDKMQFRSYIQNLLDREEAKKISVNPPVIGRFTIHGQTLEMSSCDNGEMLKIEKTDGDKILHLEKNNDTHNEGENILYVW